MTPFVDLHTVTRAFGYLFRPFLMPQFAFYLLDRCHSLSSSGLFLYYIMAYLVCSAGMVNASAASVLPHIFIHSFRLAVVSSVIRKKLWLGYRCIYRSDCPLCTAILPTLAASAHGAAHKLNNVIYLI